MANKAILVAEREFVENIRTKTFWIGILAFPVILVISIGAGWVLNRLKETKRYAVLDLSASASGPSGLADRIERAAREPDLLAIVRLLQGNAELTDSLSSLREEIVAAKLPADSPALPEGPLKDRIYRAFLDLSAADIEQLREAGARLETARKYEHRSLAELGIEGLSVAEQQRRLGEMVNEGKLFAFFTIGAEPLSSLEGFRYVSNNFTDDDLRNWYGEAATKVVQKLRIDNAGIDKALAEKLQERVRFREQKVDETGAAQDVKVGEKANKYAPIGFVYLLWIAVFTAAQMLLTNTVEEKSNRIIEVLLSSVSPLQLMAGKVWGIAATGLTIVGSWVACALLGVGLAPKFVPGFDFPLMAVIGDPLYLASFVAYFLGGYLLYAAILVGLGSVTNSLKEAQNLLQPVFILLIVPLVSMVFVVQEPNGLVARALSYVPLFTPFTMMNRAGGPPPLWEYAATGLLMLASIYVAFRAAGKVFRIGILMTGNPPRLKEILGWLREK
ncbi:MAG: ABC transporter permease [Planctomycetota bacterium]